jgi:hypothetical protein
MNNPQVLVADDHEVIQIPKNVKLFRMNPFDWWADHDLTSVPQHFADAHSPKVKLIPAEYRKLFWL